MKIWMGLGLMTAMLTGCGGSSTLSPEEKLARAVERFNRDGGSDLTSVFPGGNMKARVDNEDTLVLMVDNLPSGTRSFDPNALRRTMRPLLCSDDDFREMIDQGIKVRFEMTSNFGKRLPAVQFASC